MFRRMLQRFSEGLRRFMYGRYGLDQLNIFLLVSAVVLSIVGMILCRFGAVCAVIGAAVNLLSYGLLFWYLFRSMSRNLEARALENRRFLARKTRLTDRQNRYYRCPNCKQLVRVPRNRGKICIKCPKCSEKFIRKT